MAISGAAAAAKALETTWHRAGYCLEWAWYDVYKPVGASTGMSAGTALAAARMSGELRKDTNPPAGAAVWYGVRGDGNRDGDVCVSIGGGQVRAINGSGSIYTVGVAARAGHINREYLGWTDRIFDVQIDLGGVASAGDWPARARYGEEWVRAIQNKLNRLGFTLEEDGKDGPQTQDAVRKIQDANGLEVDGIAGPDTNAKLDELLSAPAGKLKVDGVEGAATVSREQEYLGVTVDGVRGSETITAEQTLTGAKPDGEDGPDTARHLQAYLHALGYGDIVGDIDGGRGPKTVKGLQTALNDGVFGRKLVEPDPVAEAFEIQVSRSAQEIGDFLASVGFSRDRAGVIAFQASKSIDQDGIWGRTSDGLAFPPAGSLHGVDYSFARPDPTALASRGVLHAGRYLWPNSKGITRAEFDALTAAGIAVWFIYEEGGRELLGGREAGVTVARKAEALLSGLGLSGFPIYFNVDFDAQPADLAQILGALDGIASVVRKDRVGLYGSYRVIRAAFDAGEIAWGFQTYAWSGGQWEPRAQLQQWSNNQWGGTVDFTRAVAAEFGQHPVPAPEPEPQPEPAPEPTPDGGGIEIPRSALASLLTLLGEVIAWVKRLLG